MERNQRSSGIELLRIFMMLQVIFLHVCTWGGYADVAKTMGNAHRYLYYVLRFVSRCPVNVFFLLTGYFMIKKELHFEDVKRRVFKIYIPMLFFSFVIPISLVGLDIATLDQVNIPKIFFPFLCKTWYFLTDYILIIILAPFLNRFVHSLSKKEFEILLLILTFVLCIWNPLANLKPFSSFISTQFVIANEGGKSLYYFGFLYLVGGYLSLYWKDNKKPEFKYLFAFAYCAIIQFVLVYFFKDYYGISEIYNNLFIFFQSVFLVLFFRNLNFHSKVINYISGYTLVVYIIHEHSLLRYYLWRFLPLHNRSFYTGFYIIKILVICILIYACCMFIEFLRRVLFHFIEEIGKKLKEKEVS